MCPSMAKYSNISSTMVTPRSTLWIACSSCLLMPTSMRQDLIDLRTVAAAGMAGVENVWVNQLWVCCPALWNS